MMDLQESIFFLCFVIISAAADPLKTLRASVGGSITLPDAVKEEGFLLYGGKILAQVEEKKLFKIYGENYKERLHWNQNTGCFTLTRLQESDSGIYTVGSKEGRRASVEYKLIVYDSVATPTVSVLNKSSESCSLSCSVDSAQEDTTLLWSKDQEILKKNRSAASLSLTLFYWQDLDSPLQCVAENPAENKIVSVDVRRFCQLNHRGDPSSSTDSRHLIISAAADPLKTLTASVGGNITLPDAVKEEGFLLYERNNLALVDEKKQFKIHEENYKERLHWNQNTGRFTLTRLQKSDSGIYTVDSKEGRRASVEYKLIVYDSVATPTVSVLNRSSESCSLSCSVDSAQEDTTLLWSYNQEILKKKRSAASLSLTLFYWQDLDSPLQCVAENPAENKTVSVDVRTVCPLNHRGNPSSSTISRHHLILIIIIPMVCSIIFILCVSAVWRFRRQQDSSAGQTGRIHQNQHLLSENISHQEPSESGNPILTSVYYKPAFNSLQNFNMNLQLKTEKHRQS
ncbi:uncharacterized protein LOC115390379 isoform X1 [Salarias fasciatus]|uniref:uncharacterized protein LOC115390379 isoform X1 n=1 Tax=Salarias fasciatus TaxID=181472 RepID=UPI0011764D26|nr:uncharacterized protein LOC115390379 isoform X1 [Salarias fasciatus]